MENEGEVTVVVEDTGAVAEARVEEAEVHAEASTAIAGIEAEARVEIAEAQAEAAVAISENNTTGLDAILTRLDILAAENATLRGEIGDLRATLESAADGVEEALRVELAADAAIVDAADAIESGEVPASVVVAQGEETLAPENVEAEKSKRHFVSI